MPKIAELIQRGRKIILGLVLLGILVGIQVISHQAWVLERGIITSGDWGFRYLERMLDWFPFYFIWDHSFHFGFFHPFRFSSAPILSVYGWLARLGLPFSISERVLFLVPITLFSSVGMYLFAISLLKNRTSAFFAALIYSFNTYFLKSQTSHLNICMGYALAPALLLCTYRLLQKPSVARAVLSGLIFSLLAAYEIRIAYILFGVVVFGVLFKLFIGTDSLVKSALKYRFLFLSFLVFALLQSYWVFVFLSLCGDVKSSGVVPSEPWISWQDLSRALALYHPYWTGGKLEVFTRQPINFYFFFVPLLAFLSLVVRESRAKSKCLFFSLLGLVGIFLTKQESPPFGVGYSWLFTYFPGFALFREASKFYILIAISYSVLIGITVKCFCKYLSKFFGQRIVNALFVLVLSVILTVTCIIIKPAFTQKLGKNFISRAVPAEYLELKEFLHSQKNISYVLWIPSSQRFGFYSSIHPKLSWGNLPPRLRTLDIGLLSLIGVGHIIVPEDTEDAIFKRVGPKQYFVELVEGISGLEAVSDLRQDKVKAYDNRYGALPHFYVPKNTVLVSNDSVTLPITFEDWEKRSVVYLMEEKRRVSYFGLVGRADNIFVEGERMEAEPELLGSGWYEGWAWPVVSVEPSSRKYPLVKIKEWWVEKGARGALEKADVLVWHGCKRVVESAEWGGDTDNADKLIGVYLDKVSQAVDILKGVPEEERDEDYWGMVEKVLAYMRRGREELRNLEISSQKRAEIEKLNENFRNWVEETGKFWCPEGKYCYEINIPEARDYEVLVDKESIESALGGEKIEMLDTEILDIEIPNSGKTLRLAEEQEEERWISFDKYSFDEGEGQRVALELPETPNLVSDKGWRRFNQGAMGGGELRLAPQDILPLFRKTEDDGDEEDEPHFVHFGGSVQWQPIGNWEVGEKYRLFFDYKTKDGKLGVAVLEDRTDWEKIGEWEADYEEAEDSKEFVKTERIFEKELRTGFSDYGEYKEAEGWEEFETEVEAEVSARGAELYAYAIPDEGEVADVRIRNVKVQKVLEPKVILRKKRVPDSELTNNVIPKIKFIKVNSTKYRVQVEGAKDPYTLVFSESFHKGWKIYKVKSSKLKVQSGVGSWLMDKLGYVGEKVTGLFLENEGYGEEAASYFDGEIREGTHRNTFLEPATFETWGKQPLGADHLEINGYANSWYIEPEDVGEVEDYELIVEFWPQRLFYVGLFISLTTLVGCLGYLGYEFTRRWR